MLEQMTAMVLENDICVLATAGGNRPHCSLMAYCPDPEGRRIYMTTRRDSRKFENLAENPAVSLLIDDRGRRPREKTRALTVSGTCREVSDPKEREGAGRGLLFAHPRLASFLNDPDAAILCVQVESFLLLDGVSEAYFVEVDSPMG
jgi:nitroimidazol reductase NimA-like FMN-containing flavoprotein (pyridoxamine 5'-phosphate oxidase superfamily)